MSDPNVQAALEKAVKSLDTANAKIGELTQTQMRLVEDNKKLQARLDESDAKMVQMSADGASTADLVKAMKEERSKENGKLAEMVSIMESNNEQILTGQTGLSALDVRDAEYVRMGLNPPSRDPMLTKMSHDAKVVQSSSELRELDRDYQTEFYKYTTSGNFKVFPAALMEKGIQLQAAINKEGYKHFPSIYMAEVKADTPETGALVIPSPIQADVVMRQPRMGGVRQIARVVQSPPGQGSTMKFPVQKTRATVIWPDSREDDIDRTTAPTFGFVDLTLNEVVSKIGIARHFIQDSPQFIQDAIRQDLTQAMTDGVNDELINGDSPSRPRGVMKKTFGDNAAFADNSMTLARVKSGAASTLAHASAYPAKGIIDAIFKLHPSKRAGGAAFVMHPTTLAAAMVLVDANKNTIWNNPLVAGVPGRLAGYPVIEDEWMPQIAANAYPIMFAATGSYTIFEKTGAPLVIVDDISKDQQIVTRYMWRIGGDVIDPWAIVVIQIAA